MCAAIQQVTAAATQGVRGETVPSWDVATLRKGELEGSETDVMFIGPRAPHPSILMLSISHSFVNTSTSRFKRASYDAERVHVRTLLTKVDERQPWTLPPALPPTTTTPIMSGSLGLYLPSAHTYHTMSAALYKRARRYCGCGV